MEPEAADTPAPGARSPGDAEIRGIAARRVREHGQTPGATPGDQLAAPVHEPAPADEERVFAPDHAGLAGDLAPARPPRPARAHDATRDAARRFIGRVAQLDHEGVSASIHTWRQVMRDETLPWFAAEEAAARAVLASGRHAEQKPLLIHIAEAFAHRVWYRGQAYLAAGEPAPELRVRATEASGQYVSTVAMLALLVRDHLEPAAFELLYRPFATLIPLAGLARE